jgi:raffinose/stachyose/melibiose transport system permease protein
MAVSVLQRKNYPSWFHLPALAVFAFLFVAPTLTSFYYSLTDWNINTNTAKFIGLANFGELLADKALFTAITNTLLYSFFVTLFRNLFGLILALLLNTRIKGRNILRTIFYFPMVVAPIVIGYLFKAIYNPGHGLLNAALDAAGLGFLGQDWLNNIKFSLSSVMAADIWRTSGFVMVIYLAGLQVIPGELYESASIDGAGNFWKFFHVTLPLITPTITVNVVLALIGTMKVFVMVLVLTNGGPGYATEVMNTYILRMFSIGLYGLGTAANMILTLFILVFGLPVLLLLRSKEIEL